MELGQLFEFERTLHSTNNSVNASGPVDMGALDFIADKPLVAVPYLLISVVTTVMGCVGNIFIIGAVLVDKRLRTNGNVLIVNLALADFCVTSFVNPFNFVGIWTGEGFFLDHFYLCHVIAAICLTSCFCSLQSIAAISFNRYMHICHNHVYHRIYTLESTIGMAICHWIVCFVMELPNVFGWGGHAYDQKSLNCQFDRTADYSYTLFFNFVGVITPASVVAFCYTNVYRTVAKNKQKVAAWGNTKVKGKGTNTKVKFSEKVHSVRLARTLFIIFIVFILCWSPFTLFITFDFEDTLPMEAYIFSVLLAHINSSLNCVIYGATNQDFRQGYQKFLHKLLPRKCSCSFKQDFKSDMTYISRVGVNHIEMSELNIVR